MRIAMGLRGIREEGPMLRNFMSFFGKDDLTEENVIKQIHNYFQMLFGSDSFAKDYFGVEIFLKRQDLKNAFIEFIENEMKRILASDMSPASSSLNFWLAYLPRPALLSEKVSRMELIATW
jgi:hypothetical protein